MNYCHLETPVGPLLIAGDGEAVRRVDFPESGAARPPERDWVKASSGPVGEAARQLREYFAGTRTAFDLPLAPEGTAFRRNVWRLLQGIPYGETITYGELARRAGNPKASRAVCQPAPQRKKIAGVVSRPEARGAGHKLVGHSEQVPQHIGLDAR